MSIPRAPYVSIVAALLTLGLGACQPAARRPAGPGATATGATSNGAAVAGDTTVAAPNTEGPLKVVATHSILGDLVRNVGGDEIALTVLVGPGTDAHSFEPRPADSVALAQADVIFENGLGFESWLDELVAASGTKARRVVVTKAITPIAAPEAEHDAQETPAAGDRSAAEGAGDVHGELDPHVWHDVANAVLMVEAIRDGLVQADPAHAATYEANAAGYTSILRALDREIQAHVDTLPPERRKLVTSHDTFNYFARRYGFTIVGTALGSVSTEAAEPSAAAIARLVDEIRASGVPAIFAENIQIPKLVERIAREAGVALGPTLYTDALGEPGSAGDTYLKLMSANVANIVGALADQSP